MITPTDAMRRILNDLGAVPAGGPHPTPHELHTTSTLLWTLAGARLVEHRKGDRWKITTTGRQALERPEWQP